MGLDTITAVDYHFYRLVGRNVVYRVFQEEL